MAAVLSAIETLSYLTTAVQGFQDMSTYRRERNEREITGTENRGESAKKVHVIRTKAREELRSASTDPSYELWSGVAQDFISEITSCSKQSSLSFKVKDPGGLETALCRKCLLRRPRCRYYGMQTALLECII